jgi:hypothetical protein
MVFLCSVKKNGNFAYVAYCYVLICAKLDMRQPGKFDIPRGRNQHADVTTNKETGQVHYSKSRGQNVLGQVRCHMVPYKWSLVQSTMNM